MTKHIQLITKIVDAVVNCHLKLDKHTRKLKLPSVNLVTHRVIDELIIFPV